MLKKIIFYTFLLLVIFNIPTVLAFDKKYAYNYEVKELRKDASGNVTINGWAILNAGVEDGQGCKADDPEKNCFSPHVNVSLGSGDTKDCKGEAANHYTYTLKAVPVSASNIAQTAKAVVVGGPRDGSSLISLTKTLCNKNSAEKCVETRSSCYENVAFNFTYNESLLESDDFKYGYALYLTIEPSGAVDKKQEFPLIVYKDRIKNFGNDYRYVDAKGSTFQNMKVDIIATRGYNQNCQLQGDNTYLCQRMYNPERHFPDSKHNPGQTTFEVLGVVKSNSSSAFANQTFYEVIHSNRHVWVPAAWVAPPNGSTVIMPPPDTPKEVKKCSENKSGQSPDTKSVASCNGNVKFSGQNYEDCMVDSYSYYTKRCLENNYNVSFNINDIEDASKSFLKTPGAGFTATANISTKYECYYTFDISKFETDYNNVLLNLDYYEAESPEWYSYQNLLSNLNRILENYQTQTESSSNWNSGYNFSKLKANLNITYNSSKKDTVSLVYDDENLEHLDMNGAKVTDTSRNNFCRANQSRTLNLSGLKNRTVLSDVSCQESYKVKLELPEVCLSMQTGEVESCNGENNQLTGGRMYFMDMNETGGKVELVIDKLGHDGNWKAVLTDCAFTTSSFKLKYRPIDLHDPFLQNYDKERYSKALNYYNSVYNFINIIHDDIWEDENNYMYQYTMSKTNIKNIRKDTKEDEAGSYLGRNCSFVNNKYICKFTRNLTDDSSYNKNVWFEDANINN